MTLDDLRVFVAVCRAGSLSAVARELGCTQSAVSQHVRRLEREVGVGLVERQARGVVPTRAGRVLQDAAAEGITGLDLALRRLADLVRGDAGVVRIATGGTTVRHFMAQGIVDFRRSYPDVVLEFQTVRSSAGCVDALADPARDLDLSWLTLGPAVRGIEQRAVAELPWVLAVRADDELAGRERIEGKELAGMRLIGLPENSTSYAHLAAAYGGLGITTNSSGAGVADWDTAILLAELGVGPAVVPALPGWTGPGHAGLRFVPVPDLPPLTVGWAVRRWEALSPPARAFADTVARHAVRVGGGVRAVAEG
ncbi:LysR family transcriptional regulator [Streptomyces adelaidensis]|uniref:LysR family transcriptional regulator n=1 Tax=Streptomyces adelaidensis TaxID=2796465 RepID=UPI00190758FF|nr:LysR family transcriptional regulator [Streptomyces adelaidensis]